MKLVSVNNLYPQLPQEVQLREDGVVVAFDASGTSRQVPISFNQNGKPFIEFAQIGGSPFKVWLSREFYRGFRGPIPEGYEAYHLDGNRANLTPANLDVRPKGKVPSKFTLLNKP